MKLEYGQGHKQRIGLVTYEPSPHLGFVIRGQPGLRMRDSRWCQKYSRCFKGLQFVEADPHQGSRRLTDIWPAFFFWRTDFQKMVPNVPGQDRDLHGISNR
ncbi:hypothetical protein M436DRAFT_66051 [Aureobasidium namibiae CBS 147.97]|uniref:Uncharacterized protein n=1 Tax=Aureobasidium namibiae CBS 147.97 TaxID=1043004 RepID=A0A074X7S8_9PEZI|nr:uncharacterized protein M436DRAFT_66051 [Aureobasidium namibiae CBS 147.97]KEQ70641.1 hypothetical protein M436DRAFT_66051 [Aureobasidium namibiae CBS 147.97]